MSRLVVIGGVAAGMSAASKAARIDPQLQVDVYTDEAYIAYSACSLPYYAQGVISDEESLLARSVEEFKAQGVDVHIRCQALEIRPDSKTVQIRHEDGRETWEAYDKLVIATGASPMVPSLEGVRLPGVFTVKHINDIHAIQSWLEQKDIKKAVIFGGGSIAVEMAEAMGKLGLKVTMLQRSAQILSFIDDDMAAIVQAELEKHGVEIKLSTKVLSIEGADRVTGVKTESETVPADLVIMALGVTPNSKIAAAAGIELGVRDAIQVNAHMETSLPDIYAAGDCATAYHMVTEKDAYIPLGTTANKQGRLAGENAAGVPSEFWGIAGTVIFKAMALECARTGLSSKEAAANGFETWTTKITSSTKASGYPGRGPITVKLIIEKGTNRILGGQVVGTTGAGKRIDVLAAVVQMKLTPVEMSHLDLAYAPPFSPVWDPLLVAANQAVSKLR